VILCASIVGCNVQQSVPHTLSGGSFLYCHYLALDQFQVWYNIVRGSPYKGSLCENPLLNECRTYYTKGHNIALRFFHTQEDTTLDSRTSILLNIV